MSTNKSFSTETSERYARALYEVSKESSDLEKIEADVKNFQSLFENNSEKETQNNSELKPMTMQEFQKRIDQSKEDSQNGRLTENSKLISEIEKWS